MTTTRNKFGRLALCLLCVVAMIASSETMPAATPPSSKAKSHKVKKSKKRGKGKKTSKKSSNLSEIVFVADPPKPAENQRSIGTVDNNKGNDDINKTVLETPPPIPAPYPTKAEDLKTEPQYMPKSKPQYEEVFTSCVHMPEFPGGTTGIMNFLSENIHYPQEAQDNGIQGKVVVKFVIEKDGSIGDIRIVRGVDRDLDKEAVRLCKCLPKFSPGRNADGEPVRVWYTMPITFKLSN